MEDEETSESEESSDSDDDNRNFSSSGSCSDSDIDDLPTITHTVVFKCIGSSKELHYQEILALAAKKLKEGETVPVQLQKEPHNPADANAVAIMCKVCDQWERIGYVVREALGAVHDAIDNNTIVYIQFSWVKYIVYFKNRGWYAGVTICKQGKWPQCVLQCCAKSFS